MEHARGLTVKSTRMDTQAEKRVLLANPRGFCAGVERAIEAVVR